MFNELFATRGLSLDRLKTFLEVATFGGIAKAAPDDSVRQSQSSRQIKEIETFFDVDLLQRKGKGMELTRSGRELMRLRGALETAYAESRLPEVLNAETRTAIDDLLVSLRVSTMPG